jgi:hypothetical protein
MSSFWRLDRPATSRRARCSATERILTIVAAAMLLVAMSYWQVLGIFAA